LKRLAELPVIGLFGRAARSIRYRASKYFARSTRPSLVLSELRPKWRRRVHELRHHLVVEAPALDTRSWSPRRRLGEVWGVAMVRNEVDVIGFTIEHLVAQGFDQVLIADNRSSDGTLDLLRELAHEFPVLVVRDELEAYYQGDKISVLARMAHQNGAAWVVPFDADELWFAESRPLAEHLRSSEASIVSARIWNYLPALGDDDAVDNPFLRIRSREPAPMTPDIHVAFQGHRFARVSMGYNAVRRPGVRARGLHVAHFPYRNPEQFARKFRVGGPALEATDLAAKVGWQWRAGGRLDDDALLEAWDQLRRGAKLPFDPYREVDTQLVTDCAWTKRCWLA
jgi:hypothetical protein